MAQRKKWDPERMKAAIETIRSKEMGSYKAPRVLSIPQTTLERYVKDRQKNSSKIVKTILGRKQAENNLAEHCFLLDNGRSHAPRLPTCCKKRN
jgi:hypothetical protein